MPSVRIELRDDLAAQLEDSALENETSRQKMILQAIEKYYSTEVTVSQGPAAETLDLQHKEEIIAEKEKQIQQLEQMLNCMYQLNYVLVGTKLLPAGAQESLESKKPSLWSRVRHLFGH
jgi:predicted transcriptional regulator